MFLTVKKSIRDWIFLAGGVSPDASQMNKLLNKLPLILLCTIRIDDSLFDCRVLPQQGRDGATGSGTRIGALPPLLVSVRNGQSLSEKPVTS
jgi:hypothetical protein